MARAVEVEAFDEERCGRAAVFPTCVLLGFFWSFVFAADWVFDGGAHRLRSVGFRF